MCKSRTFLCAIMALFGLISTAAYAQSYKVAIGDIPSVDSLAWISQMNCRDARYFML